MFEETLTQSGGTLTVNYSSNCVNIDEILAKDDNYQQSFIDSPSFKATCMYM